MEEADTAAQMTTEWRREKRSTAPPAFIPCTPLRQQADHKAKVQSAPKEWEAERKESKEGQRTQPSDGGAVQVSPSHSLAVPKSDAIPWSLWYSYVLLYS